MTILVVGAGIIGCAVAHELASRGARVHIFDPRDPGLGATGASAGILAPRIEGHSAELLKLGVCSHALYDQFISRVSRDSGAPVEYQRNGTLQIAMTGDEGRALAALAEQLADAGVQHTLMDGEEARRLEPQLSERAQAALLVPEHGYVAARVLTGALARAASNRGATFMKTAAERIIATEAAARVDTAAGAFDGDAVIIASGSWSARFADPEVSPAPVKPIRGQLLVLQQPARAVSRIAWGARCYLVPWNDGSMLVGATVEDVGFDETATASGVSALLAAAIDLMPALEDARFVDVRVGLRPATRDELPAIGRSSTMPRVVYATGHYRNGVLLAPLTAQVVADLVLDDRARTELTLTSPSRLGL